MDAQDGQIRVAAVENALDPKLAETYELLGVLGQGGMGQVFKARHKLLGNFVAIKRVGTSEKQADSQSCSRFLNEAKAAQRVKHENVIQLFEFGIDTVGNPYTVMEYAAGASLSDLLEENGPLSAERTIEIAAQVAAGLAHAHEMGVVHRDIKPSNIMISATPEGADRALIVDFGIAKLTEETAQRLTQTGEIFGSPFYLSPEQALGQAVGPGTDIYSLGCVMFECITGEPPFKGDGPMQTAMKHINADVPPLYADSRKGHSGLATIVATCLQKVPGDRFASAQELRTALNTVAKGGAFARRLPKAQRSKNLKILLGIAATIVLLLAVSWMFVSSTKTMLEPTSTITTASPDSARSEPEEGSTSAAKQKENEEQVAAAAAKQKAKENQLFGEVTGAQYISSYVKRAVAKDDLEAYDLFLAGKFDDSAYRLLACAQTVQGELTRIAARLEQHEPGVDPEELSEAQSYLELYMNETYSFAGECFLRSNEYSQAIEQYERCVPYFSMMALTRHYDHPQTHLAYKHYMETLAALNDKKKLDEVTKEYEKVKLALKKEPRVEQ